MRRFPNVRQSAWQRALRWKSAHALPGTRLCPRRCPGVWAGTNPVKSGSGFLPTSPSRLTSSTGFFAEGLPAADLAATVVHARLLGRLASALWDDPAVLLAIARNPACGTETLELMASHDDSEVRRAVLSTLRVGAATLRAYAPSSDPWVRSQVARSPQCPPDLLKGFAADPAERVRAALARSERCPASLLASLCRDDSRSVRYRCARNPGTTVQHVVALRYDSDPLVAAAAATNPALPVREMHLIVNVWVADSR